MKSYHKARIFGKAGFSLVEVMTVVAIIGVLLSIMLPIGSSMISAGQQRGRMNVARTIYLAVQNQLIKDELSGTLRQTIAGHNFELNGSLVESRMDPTDLPNNNV
ncbi:MAG: prepilin-type N-terminal cleavage/methylation domain-containing protein, partial [Oscillospiraceae bacterium]|nr:prepilin-type N-terminal cleavage/methylation domain-containing protein [Oscillospiraceae bacterium]